EPQERQRHGRYAGEQVPLRRRPFPRRPEREHLGRLYERQETRAVAAHLADGSTEAQPVVDVLVPEQPREQQHGYAGERGGEREAALALPAPVDEPEQPQ